MTRMPESGGDDVRKVLFLTGTRADFGKLKALMLQVDNAPEFECRVFATGMHTMRHYGNTLIEIERCGFEHIFQFMNQTEHTGSDMDIVYTSKVAFGASNDGPMSWVKTTSAWQVEALIHFVESERTRT